MAFNICFLLGALSVLVNRYTTAQSTTSLLPKLEDTGLWTADDAQSSQNPQTTTSLESTQKLDMTDKTLSIQLKVPTLTSVDPELKGLATTQPILRTQTEVLLSNASGIEGVTTAPSSVSLPFLPAVTIAEFNPSQNTTNSRTPASKPLSTSIMTIEQQATTIYVIQSTPTTSQTLEAQATESESFLGRTRVTTPGSSANIAAIGLGAGCGAVVLVVVSVMAMWLLHRHRRGGGRADGQDSDVKLERQSVERGQAGVMCLRPHGSAV